jgi:hypothetical protein
MRDLLNIIDNPTLLTEDVGLANRKNGQVFTNKEGDMITFQGLAFFPNVGQFPSTEDIETLVQNIERKGGPIEFVNGKNAGMLAFGVSTFKDENGKILRFGRYFKAINSVFTLNKWKNSDLPHGFAYSSKAAVKMTSGMMPQDVLAFPNKQTIEQVLSQVATHFGPTHPLTHLTNGISKGQPLPISVDVSGYPDLSFEAFRDYFCEILQPIAVINGQANGNAAEAEEIFFGKGGFQSAKITFDDGKNTGLFDSLLVNPQGKIIKISTKGKGGAKASIKNLVDAVKDLKEAGKVDLLREYKDVVKIINTIVENGMVDGPLELAQEFGIISGKEANTVRSMRTEQVSLTRRLQKIYDERADASKGADKIVPFYNMLAGIAYTVADYINENTNFGSAAADILNQSALIQVNTAARHDVKNNLYILDSFTATYPSTAYADIKFSASKTYFSSGCKGNFTFKINNNKEETVDAAPQQSLADIDQDTEEKVKAAIAPRVKIAPPGSVNRKMKAPPEPEMRAKK